MRRTGTVAAVTGGANGIGQAFVERLVGEGMKVAVLDIASPDETLDACQGQDGEATAFDVDITDPDGVARTAAAIERQLGPVDVLVHSAGIYPACPFLEMDFAEWQKVLDVNLNSLFHLGQAFVPGMVRRGWGRVVSMASTTFHTGFGGFTHYTASKGGLIGFTRTLADEVGQNGVTVNAIAPSVVRTRTTESGIQAADDFFGTIAAQQAIKRAELPSDLVGCMSFLTSDESAFMTGQTLVVDGGWVRV